LLVAMVSREDFPAALAAAKRGDEAAFAAVFRANQPILLRYLSVLGAGAHTEDLAAETWVAALRSLRRFEGDDKAFRGWLLTIARARWVDWLRFQSRRPETAYDELPESRAPDDVHAAVEQAMTTEAALALIGSLPADQAEIVSLRVIGGLDVAEVAVIVGKTPNHVRVLAHRGLRALAALLPSASRDSL
jgi:RNA polymerase sigma-70 factor (ECF subfamily)